MLAVLLGVPWCITALFEQDGLMPVLLAYPCCLFAGLM
jgi:hypothetical protein